MEALAVAKWIRRGPRKARRFVDLIRGRSVADAQAILEVQASAAARDVLKCLKSAIANGESVQSMDPEDMFVARAMVDEGPRMRRMRPRARGRADILTKPSCHITIVVRDEPIGEAELPDRAQGVT